MPDCHHMQPVVTGDARRLVTRKRLESKALSLLSPLSPVISMRVDRGATNPRKGLRAAGGDTGDAGDTGDKEGWCP